MKKTLLLAVALFAMVGRADVTQSLEFLEAFAWGDREDAIRMLAPNTEDYFYYRGLQLQLEGRNIEVEEHFKQWLGFLGNRGPSPRYREIYRRQRLLEFDAAPDAAWRLIRDELGLTFNHSRRDETRETTAAPIVDPSRYSLAAFRQAAHRHGGFPRYTDRGLELLAGTELSGEHRRILLGRLNLPDYPGLTDLILADLEYRDSRGFGSLQVHHLLTREQLMELGRRRPGLLRDAAYVNARLARIPAPDVDLEHDHSAAVAHYREVWDFVKSLESMHNSLKAGVLFRLLDHQRRLGIYSEELFRAYLDLPRRVAYLPRALTLQLRERPAAELVDFNYRPEGVIVLPPIGNEEPLVREYLLHFFRAATTPDAYGEWFEDRWLNAVFAESQILHGVGRPEDQAARLTPAQYRAILDRVELVFAPQNPAYLRPGEPVALQLDVKRVESIMLKVYELRTFNYYTTHRAPVDQAVELDGLVATSERVVETAAAPGRRVRHTVSVPEITERGVYVVELIGGGVSSRALLHIGRLEALSQPTAAGQAVMVFNEAGEHVRQASIWINGREFNANEHGIILLPYSENPGVRFAVLRDGDFSSPEQIFHFGEAYDFSAGIHLDPQNLPRRKTANLIMRPDLRINGLPLDPARLGDVKVTLASTDARGTRTERQYTALFERNHEWVRDFYVPDDARRLEVSVTATIKRQTDGQETELRDEYVLDINSARAGDALRQVFLQPSADGWRLEVLGLDGEPSARLPLVLEFHHPAFGATVNAHPATDELGRVYLGPLTDISRLQVSGPDNLRLDLDPRSAAAVMPDVIHVRAGESISLAYPFDDTTDLTPATLLRIEHGSVQEILNDRIEIAAGELRIAGLAAGEYRLHMHEAGWMLGILAGDGDVRQGYIFEPRRRLQETVARMPSVSAVARAGSTVSIELRGRTPSTRVMVRAARYAGPGAGLPGGFGYPTAVQRRIDYPHLQYVSGRNIGDEYRYVLDRRLQRVFAGTLLARPGLILNPWEIRETTAERERLRADEAYSPERARLAAPAAGRPARELAFGMPAESRIPLPADIGFDFLPSGSYWWVNLQPDDQGRVEINLDALVEHTCLDIIVLDRFGSSRSRHLLADREFEPRPTHLRAGLDPERMFSRQKNIRTLNTGELVVFEDLATTRYQTVRTLAQAYDLLQTLGGHDHLADFAFLKQWPGLDEAARLAKYDEFASHELHLFLYFRDREFFEKVVRPYIANKKDKTFIDRWLLDELKPADLLLDNLRRRNALELALLAQRGGAAAAIRAAFREQHELLPDDPDAFARLVRVALQAADLDETVAHARLEARTEAEKASDHLVERRRAEGVPATARFMADSRTLAAPAPAGVPADVALGMALREVGMDDLAANGMMLGGIDAVGMVEMPFAEVAELYRALPKTKELAEQNYYRIRMREDIPERIRVNGFWIDVAAGETFSGHLLDAHTSLTEIIAALSLSGLPWDADDPVENPDGAAFSLTAAGPLILVTEQILPAAESDDDRPLLISQQVYRTDDRYRQEGNEQIEKFVTGEFIRRVVYGARITLTNPTASRRRLNVLMQIPLGAIPVRNGFYTDDQFVRLDPYTTRTIEFLFYFPFAGEFGQYPAHAADNEAIIGRAEARVFRVVDAPTEVDRASWPWISQHGEPADVFTYLETHNLRMTDLDQIAWRLRDRGFFDRAADLLASRLFFHETTWSYAVYHQDVEHARVWLSESRMAGMVGPVFDSPLLKVDPLERQTYEHLEYDPLVNPRVHPVGERRKILNTAADRQYRSFLANTVYRERLDAGERLALIYYLVLQDRLTEANEQLDGVVAREIDERLQYDYLRAWMALRNLELDRALALALPHAAYPAPRWRARFNGVVDLVQAARGGDGADASEDPDRQQRLDRAAEGSPSLEIKQDGGRILVYAHNLPRATLNLYPMDIELLFSRRPFLTAGGGGFGIIKPAHSMEIVLPPDGTEFDLVLPADFRERNVVVEIAGRGLRESVTHYANRMRVRIMQSFGQIEIRSSENAEPVPRAYIKVYARGIDGRESFWKDGYTDPRGRFDYLSLNDRDPEEAARFAIMVLHPELGAVIRETAPPTR